MATRAQRSENAGKRRVILDALLDAKRRIAYAREEGIPTPTSLTGDTVPEGIDAYTFATRYPEKFWRGVRDILDALPPAPVGWEPASN